MQLKAIGLAAAAGVAGAAQADVDIVGVMTEQSNTFGIDNNEIESTAWIGVADLGSFSQSFSQLGDTSWRVEWRAPAGQFIEIAVPATARRSVLAVEWSSGTSNRTGRFEGQVPLVPDMAPGSNAFPIVQMNMSLTGPEGDRAEAVAELDNVLLPGEVYRFTALRAAVKVPASYSMDFDQPVGTFEISGVAEWDISDNPTDPGQWIRVVPSPGTATLFGIGLIAANRRRR
ncbi:MAG: hypothetical protein AAF937_06630 [Planctomycetota bacterium]